MFTRGKGETDREENIGEDGGIQRQKERGRE
jgi:hypothetical protein